MVSLAGQTLIIRAKESGEKLMQRSCPTTECCRANQIRYSCKTTEYLLNAIKHQLLKKETWNRAVAASPADPALAGPIFSL